MLDNFEEESYETDDKNVFHNAPRPSIAELPITFDRSQSFDSTLKCDPYIQKQRKLLTEVIRNFNETIQTLTKSASSTEHLEIKTILYNHIRDIDTKLNEYYKTCEQAKEMASSYQKENEELAKELKKLKNQMAPKNNDEVEAQKIHYESAITRLNTDLSSSKKKATTLEKDLNLIKQERDKLIKENKRLKAANQIFEGQVSDFKESINRMREEAIKKTDIKKLIQSSDKPLTQEEKTLEIIKFDEIAKPTPVEVKQSDEFLQKVEETLKKADTIDISAPEQGISILNNMIKDFGSKMIIAEKASEITEVSLHLLTSGEAFNKKYSIEIPSEVREAKKITEKGLLTSVAKVLELKVENVQSLGFSTEHSDFKFVIKDQGAVLDANNFVSALSSAIQKEYKLPAPPKIEEHPLLKYLHLSQDLFNSQFDKNFTLENSDLVLSRPKSKFDYYPPIGFYGYALKITTNYPEPYWLDGKDGMDSEITWATAYHGAMRHALNNEQAKDGIKSILEKNIAPGFKNQYVNHKCILTGEVIGHGVYMSPYVDVAARYSYQFELGGKFYVLVFQCRVNPDGVRIPKKDSDFGNLHMNNDYWVLRHSNEIRPYRILIKNVEKDFINKEIRCIKCGKHHE